MLVSMLLLSGCALTESTEVKQGRVIAENAMQKEENKVLRTLFDIVDDNGNPLQTFYLIDFHEDLVHKRLLLSAMFKTYNMETNLSGLESSLVQIEQFCISQSGKMRDIYQKDNLFNTICEKVDDQSPIFLNTWARDTRNTIQFIIPKENDTTFSGFYDFIERYGFITATEQQRKDKVKALADSYTKAIYELIAIQGINKPIKSDYENPVAKTYVEVGNSSFNNFYIRGDINTTVLAVGYSNFSVDGTINCEPNGSATSCAIYQDNNITGRFTIHARCNLNDITRKQVVSGNNVNLICSP
jgi:hypothetical protein